jgi:hypothetical protein
LLLFVINAHTPLLVDLHLGVEVDAGDEQVADNVQRAHAHEDVRVVEGDLLADLHHDKNDHEVGAALPVSVTMLLHIELRLGGGHTFEGS